MNCICPCHRDKSNSEKPCRACRGTTFDCEEIRLREEIGTLKLQIERFQNQDSEAVTKISILAKERLEKLEAAEQFIRDTQEIVDAAMNENMPRIRAATKAYQARLRQQTEKRVAPVPNNGCPDCAGTGEIGLADGEIFCPKCRPEFYVLKCDIRKSCMASRGHAGPCR